MTLVKQNHSIFYGNEKRYTLQDFYEIEKESEYVLSEKITNILQKLSEDVGIPLNAVNENNTNNNHMNHMKILGLNPNGSRSRGGGGGGNRLRGICFKSVSGEDTWDNIKKTNENYKKIEITKIEKAEGIEKIIQEIRICLNKMTDKNYTKQRDEIKDKMKTISVMNNENESENESENEDENNTEEKRETEKENWDEEDEKGETEKMEKETKQNLKKQKEEEWRKVGKVLFDIASTNKFFSKMYAQLYLELIEEFALFQEIIDTFIEGFITKLQTIKYVDPDKDYDGYCKYTKQQDERKAMTGFLVNLGVGYLVLGEKGRDMVEKLSQIVFELAEKVTELLDKESSTNEVEEITEILFLFFSIGGKPLMDEWKKGEKWEGILEKMLNLSKQKVKEHKSLSSRALFKFLDIQKIIISI